jgi:hypothetical protein
MEKSTPLTMGVCANTRTLCAIPPRGGSGTPAILGGQKENIMKLNDTIINWLLEESNPAVSYRTKTEILNVTADKTPVINWINTKLPENWQDINGLWHIYWITALAECGLKRDDILIDVNNLFKQFGSKLEFSCGDFMYVRALTMLGFSDIITKTGFYSRLAETQLPDGGYLCLHRVDKLKYTPKSCVKANNLCIMMLAECRKNGIKIPGSVESRLVEYYWKHKIYYRTSDLNELILNGKSGWRTIDTFYPFEVMRVGIHNIIEAFCSLGYGNDNHLNESWKILNSKRDEEGKYILDQTLTKSYLPKERVGKASKWVTFYSLLAEKEKDAIRAMKA